jgi:hypothetical protein
MRKLNARTMCRSPGPKKQGSEALPASRGLHHLRGEPIFELNFAPRASTRRNVENAVVTGSIELGRSG